VAIQVLASGKDANAIRGGMEDLTWVLQEAGLKPRVVKTSVDFALIAKQWLCAVAQPV
jgi:hypothetical protein